MPSWIFAFCFCSASAWGAWGADIVDPFQRGNTSLWSELLCVLGQALGIGNQEPRAPNQEMTKLKPAVYKLQVQFCNVNFCQLLHVYIYHLYNQTGPFLPFIHSVLHSVLPVVVSGCYKGFHFFCLQYAPCVSAVPDVVIPLGFWYIFTHFLLRCKQTCSWIAGYV